MVNLLGEIFFFFGLNLINYSLCGNCFSQLLPFVLKLPSTIEVKNAPLKKMNVSFLKKGTYSVISIQCLIVVSLVI